MLNTITARKKEEIPAIQVPAERLVSTPRKSLYRSLKQSAWPLGIIAEVKKASPSRGVLTENFHPVETALQYEAFHAAGISVLTDKDFFQGKADYLTQIKEQVNVPVLRKDFIIDEVQVRESEKIGADAVLLIAAILDGTQLKELYGQAVELGMEVLVEVHNEEEIEKVFRHFSPELIGINNRDLNTFETDLKTTSRLKPYLPEGTLLVSESGVHTKEDVDYLRKAGAEGLLVGEGFMKSTNKKQFLESLFGGAYGTD
ncbi:MAG: indole-3-glycerol phosphate synthase TrpC [Alkalicoccus sp.]|nr:MAG: indole-3-glycerol phosphate synthase TrpC [Alkalicoccus sp.]